MADEPETDGGGNEPFLKGSVIWRKVGPLPAWAWMGLALGALLAFSVWRKNRAQSEAGSPADSISAPLGNQTAPYVFVSELHQTIPQTPINITVPGAPPGGGRPDPPTTPPTTNPPVPPTPTGQWSVPIISYKAGQPKGTPSTLWGLAEKYYNNGSQWGRIWNDPQNAALRQQRGDPKFIRVGDRFWIPK